MSDSRQSIYLDYAAATPLDPRVEEAMKIYARSLFYNPSAHYRGAREVKAHLESARHTVAKLIGARPSEVTFTAGGTESANLAIHGVMARFPSASIVVSAVEHEAVLEPARKYKNVRLAPVDKFGSVSVHDLAQCIDDSTVLVSVMYANNEVGTVEPIDKIVEYINTVRIDRKKRKVAMPLWVHTDACQAPQYLELSVAKLGVDLMTLNGGKLFGPKQSGVLYHRTGVMLDPIIRGGGQEYGLRSGTENVAACIGFATALDLVVNRRQEVLKSVGELSRYFKDALQSSFPDIILNGHPKKHLPSTIHVTFRGKDNERILFALDDLGVYAAAGSACSASSETASHVLMAMGLNEADARSSIRFSIGKDTSQADIDKTIAALKIAVDA